MKKTVWLKWNGVYNNAGICNKLLKPLVDLQTSLKDIKERLKLLGFDCGKLDDELSDKTKKALVTFNSYCNHPRINNLANPCPNCRMTSLLPNDIKIDEDPNRKHCPDHGDLCRNCGEKLSSPNILCDNHQFLCPECEETLLAPNDDCKNHTILQPADYCDNLTINYLNQLFPEADNQAPPEVDGPVEPVVQAIRLNREELNDLSTTLNSVSELAVKIVSAPKSLIPFKQDAEIKLEINSTANIKSMLLRIYRNFDAGTDEFEISEEKLVYQEILDTKAIENLATEGNQNNVRENLMPRAYITKQMVGGGMTGSFGTYLGVSYDRLDAPYKFRVWVSTEENFFKKPEDKAEVSVKEEQEANIFYLDKKILERLRKLRKDSIKKPRGSENNGLFPEPEVDYKTCVHDKSNKKAKAQSQGVRTTWQDLRNENASLNRESRWTKKDSEGINLTDKKCRDHTIEYLQNNEIQIEKYASDFSEKPLEYYWTNRQRLKNEGKDFRFPELREGFDNIDRHINIVKRRLCCGQWSHVNNRLREQISSFLDRTVRTELNQLKQLQFPYDRSIRFVDKFLNYFEYIVHISIVRQELDFYDGFGEIPDYGRNSRRGTAGSRSYPAYNEYLRDRRGVIDGNRTDKVSSYGFRDGQLYEEFHDQPTKFFTMTLKAFNMMTEKVNIKVSELAETKQNNEWKQVAYPIVLPSYNPLDTYFFVKIRAVPMFVAGMIDMQYLTADGLRYNPGEFFGHDHFHIYTDGGKQQWLTLFERLGDLLRNESEPAREWAVYDLWQKNVNTVDFLINFYQGNKVDTLKFLLFCILHEPQSSSLTNPTLVEKDLIRLRLEDAGLPTRKQDYVEYIKGQDFRDFFGTYTHPYMKDIDWAVTEITNEFLPKLGNLIVNTEGKVVLDLAKLTPPTEVTIGEEEDDLVIRFVPSQGVGVNGTLIYRSTDGAAPAHMWNLLKRMPPEATEYRDGEAEMGTTYYFHLRTSSTAGTLSQPSATVSAEGKYNKDL